MDPEYIKKLIPLYLEDELEPDEKKQFEEHLSENPELRKELEEYSRAWNMLDAWEDIEPKPGYVSRFWTELSTREVWYEKIWSFIKNVFFTKRLSSAFATACVITVMCYFAVSNYVNLKEPEAVLAGVSNDELEMIEYIDLAEDYDIIADLDFWEDFDAIEQMET